MPKKGPVTVRLNIEHLGHVEYNLTGPHERFGEHVVPKELEVTFPSDSERPSLHMLLRVDDGAATCRELRVTAKEGGRGVLPADLKAVRLNEWIEDLFTVAAMKAVSEETSPGEYKVTFYPPDEKVAAVAMRGARRRGARRKLTDAFLDEVAEVHRSAGRAPTQAVADHFGVQHRTASLYIARARERGKLDKEA